MRTDYAFTTEAAAQSYSSNKGYEIHYSWLAGAAAFRFLFLNILAYLPSHFQQLTRI